MRTETERERVASEADAIRVRWFSRREVSFHIGDAASLTPTGEVGVRCDGGEAETGAGLELGTGLSRVVDSIRGRPTGEFAHRIAL